MKHLEHPPLWRAVLMAMLVPLALVAFWPTPVDQPAQGLLTGFFVVIHALGIPGWINYTLLEASANVVLFLPVGAVASLAFPKKRLLPLAAFGLAVSGCMELGQQLFLHERVASPMDLVTNTVGCVIGVLAAPFGVRELKRRQAQRQPALSLSETNW